jgi:hypothetical protein
MKIA